MAAYTRWARSWFGTAVLALAALIIAVTLYARGNYGWAAFFAVLVVVRIVTTARARLSER